MDADHKLRRNLIINKKIDKTINKQQPVLTDYGLIWSFLSYEIENFALEIASNGGSEDRVNGLEESSASGGGSKDRSS